jgi:methanogenic corrinoid protein MtbC1
MAILLALADAPLTVNEIVAATGLSQPNVSNHLGRLRARQWVHAHREGRRIYYSLSDAAIIEFIRTLRRTRRPEVKPADPSAAALLELEEAYLTAALSGHENAAVAIIEKAGTDGIGWETLYLRVFRPVLERIGDLWAHHGLPVATEHAATAITLRMMHRLQIARDPHPVLRNKELHRGRYRALVACVPGEQHMVGARMVADFLEADCWEVVFLGADLPTRSLIEAAILHLPHAIFLSAATPERHEAVAESLAAVREWRSDRTLPLIVAGGLFFRQEETVWAVDILGDDLPSVLKNVAERLRQHPPLPGPAGR